MALFDAFGPIVCVVVVAAEAWDAYPDCILCSAYDAVVAFGLVFETEHELCQHLGVHIGQSYRPQAMYLLAGGCREAAALKDVEVGHERNGDGPPRGVGADVGLVDPCACKVEACGYAAVGQGALYVGAATRREPVGRCAVEHYVFDAMLFAILAFFFA